MTETIETFEMTVPHYKTDAFRACVAKFVRWCEREELPGPSMTEEPAVLHRPVYQQIADGTSTIIGTLPIPSVKFNIVTSLARLPGGWNLAAVITPTENGIVTTHAPGAPIVPASVLGNGMRCDHCECSRRRIETFVLVDAAGSFRMVGRNCIRAYLGVDPARWAAYLRGYAAIMDTSASEKSEKDDRGGGFAMRSRCDQDIHRLLSAALFIVRERGCYFKADPTGERATPSTRSEVSDLLNPWPILSELRRMNSDSARFEENRLIERVRTWEAADRCNSDALAARRWAATIPVASTMEADMASIAAAGVVPDRSIGLACWIAAAWLRETGELGEVKKAIRTNEYIATEGARVDLLDCTLVHASEHDTAYGSSTLLIGYTCDGRKWKCWYSGSGSVPSKADTFAIRATVKATGTDDKDGTKITTLTRAKFTM